jgi:lipocalin-like protein
MRTLAVIGLSAILAAGAGLSPGSVGAQQKSLKDQLIGTWTLVSCESTSPNGAKQPFCVNPNGILILDASGRYAQVIAARGRPKFSGGNRAELPAEQFKAAAMGLAANFGTWSVSEGDKTITRHYEGALFPNVEGADFKSAVNLSGDELKLVSEVPNLGGKDEAVYRSVK